MTTLVNLFAGGWNYVLAGLAIFAAVISAYMSGKSKGKTEEKAKADVQTAKVESAQVAAVAQKKSDNAEIAKNVSSINSSLSDDAARDKLHNSKYNQP